MADILEFVPDIFSGYEADFTVQLVNADQDALFQQNYEAAAKDYVEIRKQQDPTRPFDPWIDGGLSIREDSNGMTEVTVRLVDPGIVMDNGDINYFWMAPSIVSRLKAIFIVQYISPRLEKVPPLQYKGYLKEMKPTYRFGAPPLVEYTFLCSGFEMTRVIRSDFFYPALPQAANPPLDEEVKKAAETNNQPKSYVRDWAVIKPEDPTDKDKPRFRDENGVVTIPRKYQYSLTLSEIFKGILENNYGYVCQFRSSIDILFTLENFRGKAGIESARENSPAHQEVTTDWGFLIDLAEKFSLAVTSEPVKQKDGGVKYTYYVDDLRDQQLNPTIGSIQFWFHRQDLGTRVAFNPFADQGGSMKFIMMNEPSVTVNSNWQMGSSMMPVEKEEDVEESVTDPTTGEKLTKTVKKKVDGVYQLSDTDENGKTVVYELNLNSLNSPEAEYQFKRMQEGKGWSFADVKKFFIANASGTKYPEGGGAYTRHNFLGIEMSFSTIGNPYAQVNKTYPILGLGAYYSVGEGFNSGVNEDLAAARDREAQEEEYNRIKFLEEQAKKNAKGIVVDSNRDTAVVKTQDIPTGNSSVGTTPLDKEKKNSKLMGLRLKGLTHSIEGGQWTTNYDFGM